MELDQTRMVVAGWSTAITVVMISVVSSAHCSQGIISILSLKKNDDVQHCGVTAIVLGFLCLN